MFHRTISDCSGAAWEPRQEALETAFYAALRHEATDTILTRYRKATREL